MTGSSDFFVGVAQRALWATVFASAPILIPVLVVGLLIGIVQAATSINETTLSFVPKLLVTAAVLVVFGTAIMGGIADFATDMFTEVARIDR